jgi:hypothetical protein
MKRVFQKSICVLASPVLFGFIMTLNSMILGWIGGDHNFPGYFPFFFYNISTQILICLMPSIAGIVLSICVFHLFNGKGQLYFAIIAGGLLSLVYLVYEYGRLYDEKETFFSQLASIPPYLNSNHDIFLIPLIAYPFIWAFFGTKLLRPKSYNMDSARL